MTKPIVVNVVGGGSIGREMDLSQVYQDFPENSVEYNPSSFGAVIVRYSDPKATVILFSSGKYSVAGAQSIENAREASRRFMSSIEQMLQSQLPDKIFEIRYLVATADLGSPVDLNEVMIELGVEETEYEPEQFPALLYRPKDRQWLCSIFGTGKIVINKCKSMKQIQQAYADITDKLAN